MIQIDLKGLSESSGSTFDAPAAGRDHLLSRFLNKMGKRWQKFDVNRLGPEAKAEAGQALFLSAQDVAKIRLSGERN